MIQLESVSRISKNKSNLIFPDDLYVDGKIKVEFVNVFDVIKIENSPSYNDENSIGLRFVGDDEFIILRNNIIVEYKHEIKNDWIKINPWNTEKSFDEYAIMLGTRYRVINNGNTVFEIRPPALQNVLDIVNRSVSSFSINLHKMMIGNE